MRLVWVNSKQESTCLRFIEMEKLALSKFLNCRLPGCSKFLEYAEMKNSSISKLLELS